MSGKTHPVETKAAVIALLAVGTTVSAIAQQFHIDRKTVNRWKEEMPPPAPVPIITYGGEIVAMPDAPYGTHAPLNAPLKKREELQAKVYSLMELSIDALIAQVRLLGDTDYLRAQPLGDLATAMGILSDKTARILTAYEIAQRENEDAGE